MAQLDAVVIATDLYREVPGAEIRDRIRLSVEGQPATMEFLLQYFRAGRDPHRALGRLRQERLQRVPLPLNGPYLYHVLGRRGLKIQVVPFFSHQQERLLDLLRERPRAVIISTTFLPFAPQIEAMAAFVRQHAPNAVLIAGGIQIWKSYRTRALLEQGELPADILGAVSRDHYLVDPTRPSALDLLVVSDAGESTLAQLLWRIRDQADYRDLPNLAWHEDGGWHLNPVVREPEGFLGETLDWQSMPSEFTKEEIPVHVGTGCPYRCAFCDFCQLRPIGRRPVAALLRELRSVPMIGGVRQVFFTDDNLFFSVGQLREFCEAIRGADLSLRWRAFLRADTVNQETAGLLYESGCRECLLGVESGDAEMLARMNKKITPEQVLHAVGCLNQVGINTQSTFLVGFPGETDKSVQNTIDLLNAYPTKGPGLHVYYPFFFLLAPLARVASAESRARYRLHGYLDRWDHATMDSEGAKKAVQRICDATKLELSPIYHGERIVPWLTADEQKRVFVLRNRISRLRRGILPPRPEEPLWKELEDIFSPVAKMNLESTPARR
jgi:anaerobic magnesium-protoporphyrin IX monomethyl ester cyclase